MVLSGELLADIPGAEVTAQLQALYLFDLLDLDQIMIGAGGGFFPYNWGPATPVAFVEGKASYAPVEDLTIHGGLQYLVASVFSWHVLY